MNDNYSASFSEQPIIGRSTPILTYTGGSSKELSFTIVIHEDILPNGNILAFVDKIRALSYPSYTDGSVRAPRTYIKFGNMFSIWGVVNCSVSWSGPVRDGHYLIATLNFTIKNIGKITKDNSVYVGTPLDAQSVENGSDR